MIDANVVERALSIAGKQVGFALGELKDDGQTMPSLWSYDGAQVHLTHLMASDSDAAERMARRAIEGELAGRESVSLCVDIFLTDPSTGQRQDALYVTVVRPGSALSIRYVLPYERRESGLAFPSGVQIVAAEGLPDDFAATRLEDAVRASLSLDGAATDVSGPPTAPDGEGILLGGAALAVFALVACADGSIDEKEVRAFIGGINERLAGTKVLAEATLTVLARGGLDVVREVVGRGAAMNLLHVAAAGHALDARLGADAMAEKQALHDLGTAVARASGWWWNRVSKDEQAALDRIAKMLQLA